MGLFNRKTKNEEPETRAVSASVPPVRSETTLTTETALSIAAVYRSVSILSTSVSQLPVGVFRGSEPLQAPAIITKPDVNEASHAFISMTVTSLAMNGNAYWLLNKNDRGQVNNAQVLNPNGVAVKVSDSGVITYQYGDKTYRRDQIKHLKLLRVPGSLYGLGPIQAARQELEGQLGLRDYQANWFVNSGVPTGVLSSDQMLNQELAEQYRDRWLQLQADRTVAVLGSGVTYSPTLISPKDALFIEVSNFSVNQVARMFGIPGLYLTSASEGTSLTYSTTESIDAAYLKYTLSQYLVEIESALSDLIPRGQTVRFKADALLRTDTAARYAAYAIGIDKGFMSTDEVRASEGLTGAAPQVVDGAPV